MDELPGHAEAGATTPAGMTCTLVPSIAVMSGLTARQLDRREAMHERASASVRTRTIQIIRFRRATAATSGLIAAIALYGCGQKASEGQSQVVGGLRFEYGVVRSETVLAHPSDHPERIMHQGVPTAPDTYHFVLAVFDAKSGVRIKDADASLELSGPGHPGHVVVPLEPMAPVGDVTYGGYMSLPSAAKYRLTFDVAHAGGRPNTVKARFLFERPS